jgi:hypothetical protein
MLEDMNPHTDDADPERRHHTRTRFTHAPVLALAVRASPGIEWFLQTGVAAQYECRRLGGEAGPKQCPRRSRYRKFLRFRVSTFLTCGNA